jgi:hypothetical protein
MLSRKNLQHCGVAATRSRSAAMDHHPSYCITRPTLRVVKSAMKLSGLAAQQWTWERHGSEATRTSMTAPSHRLQ